VNRTALSQATGQVQFEVDDADFRAALMHFYRNSKQSLGEVIRSQSRLVAVNLVFQTQPFGGSKATSGQDASGKILGEGAIERDVRKVYKTASDVFRDVAKTSVQAAKGFVSYIKSGRLDEARKILQRINLRQHSEGAANLGSRLDSAFVSNFDGGQSHREALAPIPRRPRIKKKQKPLMIVQSMGPLKAYIKEVQKRVGIAKSGWATCAVILGGTRGRSATNVEGISQQSVPAWVKRHAGNKGSGTVIDRSNLVGDAYVDMVNHVPWIRNCLNAGQQKAALDIQREKMEKAIDKALEYEAGSAGFNR
jgi:AraC-like DNA-binding protein